MTSPWKATTLHVLLRAFIICWVNLLSNLFKFQFIFYTIVVTGAPVPHWPCPVPLLSTSPTHKHPWSNSSPSPSTADHQSRALKRDMLPCWLDREEKKITRKLNTLCLFRTDTYWCPMMNSCSQWQSKGMSHDPRRLCTEEEAKEEWMQGQAAFLLG